MALLLAALLILAPGRAPAQGLIRDAEIERTLKLIANPILNAAGMGPRQVTIYIIDEPSLNAFVAGGNNIFLNTGLLRRLDTIDKLRAVLAHELAHITGGHLIRRNDKIRAAQGTFGIGILLAIAAAVAAGDGRAGVAPALIGAEMAQRDILSHSRAEESAADQSALRYMVGAGADPTAILDVMRFFQGQDLLSERYADPYVRTHPLWSTRIRYMEDRIASAPRGKPPSERDSYWHRRMVAKFDGFLGNPRQTLRSYEADRTEIGALARAIAYHRLPDRRMARATMDALLKARPDDPFYNELNGQFALESGNAGAAVTAYRRAASLAPDEPLILAGLGRALVALDQPGATREALDILTRARSMDDAHAGILRDLAVVHARSGRPGQASLATAERFVLQGRLRDADIHARRAMGQLPEGSAGWRQARDIRDLAGRANR